MSHSVLPAILHAPLLDRNLLLTLLRKLLLRLWLLKQSRLFRIP
jgi:hypothetical protein